MNPRDRYLKVHVVTALLFFDQSGSESSSGTDSPRFSLKENPDLDDENDNDDDDDDERFVVSRARAPVCLEAFERDTSVCVRSATVINHL